MRFDRVYHPVSLWEEIRHNMWGDHENPKQALQDAIALTADHAEYGRHMVLVALNWHYSCENALTDYSLNRKAWIGHAACALALNIPEDITRLAWGHLSNEQQLLANAEAESAIQMWERSYAKSIGLHIDMEKQVLL